MKQLRRQQLCILAVLCAGNILMGANNALHGPLFPLEAEKKGVSKTAYGFIQASYRLTVFLLSPIFGKLISNTEHLRWYVVISALFHGLPSIAIGFLSYIDQREVFVGLSFAILILEGCISACFRTSAITAVSLEFSTMRTTAFSLLQLSVNIGSIVGPLIGVALDDVWGFVLPFGVLGTLLSLIAPVLHLILPSYKNGSQNVKLKGAWNFWCDFDVFIYFMNNFSAHGFIGFNKVTLALHLQKFSFTGLQIGAVFTTQAAIMTVASVMFGYICDRKNCSSFLIIGGFVLSVLSHLLIGPAEFLHLDSLWWIVILGIALEFCATGAKIIASFSGCVSHTTNIGFPTDLTTHSLISAMVTSGQAFGNAIGLSAGGVLVETLGYDQSSLVLVGFDTVLLIIIVVYYSFKKLKTNFAI